MYFLRRIREAGLVLAVVLSSLPMFGQTIIAVDAGANMHPISDLIYGVNFANSNELANLNSPLNRSGGNAETRYNWNINAHNRGADWYFESLPDSSNVPGAAADDHVANSKAAGSSPMVTIPMLGWAPKDRNARWSYSIAKYGTQDDHDYWYPDAGNGTHNSIPITNNDPTDANMFLDPTNQVGFVKHLTNRWGTASNGGVRYYVMDNEPSLWNSTHFDVHHNPATLREVRDKFFDYGAKVKSVDANAQLCAPEEWGWLGYFYSAVDQQYVPVGPYPDRGTNGNMDFIPWFLDQARQYEMNNGKRLLDVLTVHYYPQGDGTGKVQEYGTNVTTTAQLLRNRSTRALWDTNYSDPSWIQSTVMLVPRFKQWIASYYPGTKFGVTEYNWGAEDHINGATAQADILGIFGREGVDLATRWTTPVSNSPVANAFKLYRNYDGNKSTFGDTSVATSVPNADAIAAFSAVRSKDGALTVMLINKQLTTTANVQVALTNFYHNCTAQCWQMTSNNVINSMGTMNFSGASVGTTLPPQSITLMVLPRGAAPQLSATPVNANNVSLMLKGYANQKYVIESSSNSVDWSGLVTNLLSTNTLTLNVNVTTSARFYRAYWTAQ